MNLKIDKVSIPKSAKIKVSSFNGIKMKGYKLQTNPTRIPVNKNKIIEEHFGLASDGDHEISVAQMTAPPGWSEPYQTPNFDEFTLVISEKNKL